MSVCVYVCLCVCVWLKIYFYCALHNTTKKEVDVERIHSVWSCLNDGGRSDVMVAAHAMAPDALWNLFLRTSPKLRGNNPLLLPPQSIFVERDDDKICASETRSLEKQFTQFSFPFFSADCRRGSFCGEGGKRREISLWHLRRAGFSLISLMLPFRWLNRKAFQTWKLSIFAPNFRNFPPRISFCVAIIRPNMIHPFPSSERASEA